MAQKTVVLLEDDPEQISTFKDLLERTFSPGDGRPRLVVLSSESAFNERISELLALDPALFVLDVMTRWKGSGITLIPKPERAPSDEAGIRCKDIIRQRDKQVPVVLWTVIELDTLPESARAGCQLLEKSDPNMRDLLARLRN